MNRKHTIAAAMAATVLAWSLPSEAQQSRQRWREPETTQSVEQPSPRNWRQRDIYSVRPGAHGTITATTPNESGNLGGPYTGGGNSGGP